MTYQGHLVDALGQPVGADQPTAKTIQFRIYTAETGGEVKYAEEQTVTVDKGYFSVLLGQGSAIPESQVLRILHSQALFLMTMKMVFLMEINPISVLLGLEWMV